MVGTQHLTRLFFIASLFLFASPVWGETFKLGILHGDQDVFAYEISVIKLGLANAPGNHKLELVLLKNTAQKRFLNLLEHGERINLFFTGYSREREEQFLQIDIPLTRGLLGHRIFITRQDTSLKNIESLADLKKLWIGSGIGWPDTEIFKHAGFHVIQASYENLWRMLAFKRYDLFNRGINEAYVELEQQRKAGYDFAIDPYLSVTYPFDYFIYVNRRSEDLYHILKAGLEQAYKNGQFMEHFINHPTIAHALKISKMAERRTFRIPNPLLSPRAQAIPDQYWHKF
jgi:hypothetical protein